VCLAEHGDYLENPVVSKRMKQGLIAGILAYTLWGLLPAYWKAIQVVPPLEILCHRTIWSLAFVLLLLAIRKQWAWLGQVRSNPRTLLMSLGSACLLGLNWFIYIWAVNSGHVVDSSLGYFITPLVNVLLGVLFLRERLRVWQMVAIGSATLGVLALTLGYGAFPWIALSLALSFGFYGLLRKVSPLGSLEGLSLETATLSLPAVAYLVYLEATGGGSFGHAGTYTTLLLAGTGIVTALPLLLFAFAARQVTLATVGILQYIAPTFQFFLGVLVYGEPFTPARLLGFIPIWLALVIYSVDGLREERRRRPKSRIVP
jgi:chloramphenicol-sensitive protein RarD